MRPQPLKVTIDEIEYTIGHWTVDKSTEMLAWILESFGPTFRAIFEATGEVEKMSTDTEMGIHFLTVVSKNLPSVLNGKEYSAKIKDLADGILANNSPIVYNNHFTGKIMHLHKVVFEVLKFQYADFLDVALAHRR